MERAVKAKEKQLCVKLVDEFVWVLHELLKIKIPQRAATKSVQLRDSGKASRKIIKHYGRDKTITITL